MKFLPRGLARKLIIFLTIIVALVSGISGYISVKTQERQLLDAMVTGADQLSRGISSATWHAMLADNRQAAYDIMQTIALKQGIDKIRIFNKEGRIMYSTRPEENLQQVDKRAEACFVCHASDQPLVRVDVPSRSRVFRDAEHGNERKLAIITPIYNEPSCSQAECHAHPASVNVVGVLDVALDLQPIDDEVAAMTRQTVIVTGIQILLIAIFIVFFTRYVVARPIRKLIAGTKAVAEMKLERPIDINSSEEIDELAHSFNVMRERLKVAVDELNDLNQSLETKVDERTQQLKTAHQKLLQTDRLASLGQLSASVAHEINNPVSGVLNLSMLMQRLLTDQGIPAERLPEFKKYLAQVVNETSRVGRIVSDLLAFSRRQKPQRTKANINTIIQSTLNLLAHKLKLGNVNTELRLDPKLPDVDCDPSQIQQVIINLVMNGAEATQKHGGGMVTVTTGVDRSGQVFIDVSDDGEGISEANRAKLFTPFFTTKDEGKGVGLGLAVVYGIVDAHGGEIDVQSNVGRGSTFRVTLPISAASGAQ
jgi:two-component system NtrC family sensor kinase